MVLTKEAGRWEIAAYHNEPRGASSDWEIGFVHRAPVCGGEQTVKWLTFCKNRGTCIGFCALHA
jgi:hypothetical protein